MGDLRTARVRMRLFYRLLKQPVPKQIERYSRFSPSPLSIKQFLDFGECDALHPPPRPEGAAIPNLSADEALQPQGKVCGNLREG